MSLKRTYWIFASYVAALLVSVLLFYMLPEKSPAVGGKVQPETANKELREFDNLVHDGRLGDIDPRYKKKQWKFQYQLKQLNIEGYIDPSIVIERKQGTDGTIEAIYFATDTILEGFKISKLPSVNVRLNEESLIIDSPEPIQIELGLYSKEFPIRQFTDEQFMGESKEDGSTFTPMEVIYLRVPKDLEITGASDMDITYINK
ncbi:hypothetical protein JOC74_000584 [Bacillus capparidis]|uniref:Uncharacterized protein n=1 Tax=Bacillus capparidis TaxID=1840411 RepID=A0ABS4CSE9_9BACI|nr:hypothetical protein [Bacillus capparidis]MBP1080096.1 hypothetical protein [Bacillus capparidis]